MLVPAQLGLELAGDHLYLADGVGGLKVFDVSEPEDIELEAEGSIESEGRAENLAELVGLAREHETVDEFLDEPGLTRISATIVVPRDSHKGIVIGKGGAMLKAVGTLAREQIEALLGRKVFLKLWVKVVEDWTNNPRRVRELTSGQDT